MRIEAIVGPASIQSVLACKSLPEALNTLRCDINKQVRVHLGDQPALDTGGVPTQLYSTVFMQFDM